MRKKLKHIQYIILFNLFILFGFFYIYLLDNNSKLVYNTKYTNPLMINKAIDYNIKNKDFDRFIINLNLKNTNVNIPNHKGITLLMKCIIDKCDNIYLEKLISVSNKNYKNKYGETPIIYSILFGNFNAFKALISSDYSLSKYNSRTLLEVVNSSDIKQKSKYLIILKSMTNLK